MGDRPSWNRRSPDMSMSPSLQQMFTLARRMGYEMRPITGQPDAQRRPPGNRPSPDQNRGFVLQHVPAGITRGSSASAVESSVICRVVAKDRTLLYPLNRRVGTYNLTTGHHVTETTVRETLRRPGHHPHRSICTSFGPLIIFIHHINLISSVTGYRYHTYSSTIEDRYRNIHVIHGSAGYGITGGAFTGRRGTTVIC